MSGPTLIDGLQKKFGDQITGSHLDGIDPWIEVSVSGLIEVLTYLRDDSQFRLDYLNSITCVDYLHTDPKKVAKSDWEPHLEVVYHLWSVAHKHSLVVKVILSRWKDDQPGQLPEVPTASGVWPAADWHEREAYDLFGVRFTGHPNMRRILCPEDWVGHPLRKDYEMPLEYHGIRGR